MAFVQFSISVRTCTALVDLRLAITSSFCRVANMIWRGAKSITSEQLRVLPFWAPPDYSDYRNSRIIQSVHGNQQGLKSRELMHKSVHGEALMENQLCRYGFMNNSAKRSDRPVTSG